MNVAPRPLKLIFATWEGGGCVPPVIAAARKMARRGHDVRLMSDACNRAEAEAAGLDFVPWTNAPSRPDKSRDSDILRDWEAPGPAGLMRVLDAIIAGPALAYAQDLSAELDRKGADLVVSLEMLMGVLAACEARRQAVVALAVNICVPPLPGAPTFGGGLAPAKTPAEQAELDGLRDQVQGLFDSGLPALNAARQALGLRPLKHLADQLLAAEALVMATSAAFDFPWTAEPMPIRYVGPQLDDPSWAADWASPWAPDDQRPLVLVAFSTTFQDHVGILQRTLEAMAELPVRVLLTGGGSINPGELTAPANAVVVDSAPHGVVMREAALVITHGGHGTLIKALAAGLPMLVIPHGRDQVDNARRASERGAALTLGNDVDAPTLRAAVQRLLGEPDFRRAAKTLGSIVAADAGGSGLEEALEAAALCTV